MALAFACGAECNLLSAGHWGPNGNGSPTIDTGTFRTGARAFKFVQSGAGYVSIGYLSTLIGSTTVVVQQFWVYFTAFPDFNINLWQPDVTVGNSPLIRFVSATGVLRGVIGSAVTGDSAALSLNTWYRIDVRANVSANPRTLDFSLNGTTVGSQASSAETLGAWGTNVALGINAPGGTLTAGTLFIDDVVTANATGDYPIASKQVLGYKVGNTSGTHSTPADFTKSSTGSPSNGDTSGSLVNETTPDTTTYIAQTTILSTAYWEGIYASGSAAEVPDGVEQLVAVTSSTTAADTEKAQLYDGTTATDMYALSTVGSTSLVYRRKFWTAAPSGAWTNALLKLLRIRWGFSTDITPNPRLSWTIIETVSPTPVAATGMLDPYGESGFYGA